MKRVIGWLIAIALAVGAGFFIRANVISVARVAGDSMRPALESGDMALITRYDYKNAAPARYHVVQAEIPGRDGLYLKRVIGLPGEKLEILDGVVHINGQALAENYATPSTDDISVTLGEDEYFLMGDNRPDSYDSREEDFGAVNAGCFRGRVRAVLWPLDRIGSVH